MEKESIVDAVNPQTESDNEDVNEQFSFDEDGYWAAPRATVSVPITVNDLHKQCSGTLKNGVGPGDNRMCAVPWLPLSASKKGAHEF